MNPMTRRRFLGAALPVVAGASGMVRGWAADAAKPTSLERIRGMMLGTFLGDALGGPIEFQAREAIQKLENPPKVWKDGEVLDAPAREAAAKRLVWRSYKELRPKPESYGQWNDFSERGTITDDSRHKLVLLAALHRAAETKRLPMSVRDLAKAYLEWPECPAMRSRPKYRELAADWLEEWQFSARWVLGVRDEPWARPPERMWNGIPTCCGQMTLPPVAALYVGQPERAYRAAYQLAYFDNGFGRDMNAALVAGLATALATPMDPKSPREAWETVLKSIRNTDPYGYGKIRWSTRAVHRWMELALNAARDSARQPARLFAVFDEQFRLNSKWEAQVPFVVTLGCLALAEYDPIAAWQLSLEWGWDTDSYAQMVGAFIGALYGPGLFEASAKTAMLERLRADVDVDLEAECRFLDELNQQNRERPPVAEA